MPDRTNYNNIPVTAEEDEEMSRLSTLLGRATRNDTLAPDAIVELPASLTKGELIDLATEAVTRRVTEKLKLKVPDHRDAVLAEAMDLRKVATSIDEFDIPKPSSFITEYAQAAIQVAGYDLASVAALLRVKARELEDSVR